MTCEKTCMPSRFSAGETLEYRRSLACYPAGQGWTLTLYLVGATAVSENSFAATADGDAYLVAITAAQSAAFPAGNYRFLERVSRSGEAHDATVGYVEILPDLATATPAEVTSSDELLLAAIEAVLLDRTAKDVQAYTIGNRQLTKIPYAELMTIRNRLQTKLKMRRFGLGAFLNAGPRVKFTGTGNES